MLVETFQEGAFVELEEVYDRVSREKTWYCMRQSGVAGKYLMHTVTVPFVGSIM